MRTIRFNFNNEQGILELSQNTETNVITVPGQEDLPTFTSIEEFAEFYAIARNVSADNLKNWVLREDGDVYSYVLRAGTAGISGVSIREDIEGIIEEVKGTTHFLIVQAFSRRVLGAPDIVEALIADPDQTLAQAVYDKLNEGGFLVEPEVDTRSALEVHLDEVEENLGSFALYAKALNLPVNSTREQIVAAANLANMELYDLIALVDTVIETLYATTDTSNVVLLTALVAQGPVGVTDEDTVKRLVASATFAGRDGINIRTVKFGTRFVKDTSEYVLLADLDQANIRTVNGKPILFVRDAGVDTEMEAEITERREKIRAAAEAERNMYPYFDECDSDCECEECDY